MFAAPDSVRHQPAAARYIGRVGALAIALGIGGAVAAPPWLAAADDSASPAASAAAAGDERGGQRTADRPAPSRPVSRVPGPRRAADAGDLPAAPAAQHDGSAPEAGLNKPTVNLTPVDLSSPSRAVAALSALTTPASAPAAATAAPAATAAIAATEPGEAVARPAAAVATGVPSVLSPVPAGKSLGAPAGGLDFITAALSLISREITRIFFNQTPTANPILTSQTNPVITGSIAGFDPNGDPLEYSVAQGPANGSVVVDSEGNFVYTANPDLAATGGPDTFVFEVRDTGFHLNFWTPTTISVPLTLNVLTSQSGVEAGAGDVAARTAGAVPAAAATAGTGSVTYSVGDNWGSGFIGNMTVTAGPSALNGWTVSFTTPAEITNIWNGVISSHVGTAYVVTNADWNGQVGAGQSTSFGFQATTGAGGSAVTGLQLNGVASGTTTPPGASVGNVTVAEPASGTAQATFTVTLSKASTTPVTIGYATANGTATAGADYTATTGTLTFAPGVTSQQISVPILRDTTVEPSETFTVTLSNPSGATITTATATGTITDTPPPTTAGSGTVTYAVGDNWGSGFTGNMTVTAGQGGLNGWTVSFTTPAEITNLWNGVISSHVGTAYVVTNAPWNGQLSAGQSASFGFQAATGAGGSAVTGLQLNGVASGTTTPPGASVGNVTVAEPASGTAQATFTVTLSKASTTPVTIGYATANGTATAGSDYTATTGTLSFAPGVISQQISVPVRSDTVVEPSETFTVTLSNPSGATITTATATATITDSTAAGTAPTVSIADASVIEGNSGTSTLAFTATLSKASATAVTVNYATSNGTATAGQDYTAGSGTITFAPGVISQTVNVAVTGDTTVEPTETLTVTLSTPSGATIARAVATGTILTDDTTTQAGGTTAQWGNAFFAPYVDMAGWPVPDLVAMSKATGASLFTLGFLQVDPNGNPAWGGYSVLEPTSTNDQAVAINKSIAALRAAGGDVMISFGGVAGTSLAQSYAARGLSAQALANAYAGVVDTYGVNHLDFDIEGAAIADAAAIALNSAALKLLQQSRPQVQIWYTLPVLPQGLTADGLNVVQSALSAGVKLAGVNVMAMDYGEGPAPTTGPNAQTMGTYAIQSAQSTYTQLSSMYAKNGQTFTWGQIGVTPMIGVNDITTEVFTVADAKALNSFALTKGLGMIGFWSVERDYPGTLGQPTHNASGLSDPAGSFSGAFNKYGTINVVNYGGTPALTPGLSISDASATEPGSGGMAPGFLRTAGNQIVDSQGKTVAISGVNWFGMESTTQAPHGLWTRGYKDMINQMAGLGFNTIRLPFSSELLHTTAAPNGIDFSKNPDLQGLSGLQVMDAIIAYAGQQGMRVILDHHRSGAGAGTSDNGLWYDATYTEDAWVSDWAFLANRYKNNPTVIGVDLHNEPHNGTWGGGGATDWARAAERAGNAVLAANPNLLVFVEGVETYQGQNYWWGGNLMGVKDRPIVLNVANRVVYSPHDYPNSVFPQTWFQTADFGAGLPAKFRQMWGYIYEQNIAPVYIGEFGTKLQDPKDAVWLEALTSYISGDLDNNGTKDIPAGAQDISWTYWSWNPNSGDTGGILADDWLTVNQNKMTYLTPIQFTGAGGSSLAVFTVTLSSASTSTVTVGYATSNGTATAGSDYVASTGTITFAPGETTKTIAIIVNGDATAEAKETFTVTLSNPSGATLLDGSGAGSITDRVLV